MLTWALIVFVTLSDGETNSFKMDYDLSAEDCAQAGQTVVVNDAHATWVCVPELVPSEPQPFSLLVDVEV